MSSTADPVGSIDVALAHATRLLHAKPDLAADQVREILKVMPEHLAARLVLGTAQRLQGDVSGSLATLEPLVAEHPNWPLAHHELSRTFTDAERFDDAVRHVKRAVALKPDLPDAWRELGDLLRAKGDENAADEAYARHIKASTRDPRLMGAALALCENRIGQAELLLREHLKKFPTDVAAIRMFAEVAGRLKRFHDAEKLLVRCLELAPTFNAARYNYAMALYRLNRFAEALQQIELLTASEPRNSGYRNLKAAILAGVGAYPESLHIYADVLAKHPGEARIWMSYGHALSSAGRTQDSIAAYRRCISLAPTLGEAYYSLANLKTFRFEETEVLAMQALLSDARLTDEDRANFHFSIGKAQEDSGRYGESFEHYRAGNQLKAARSGYDPEATSGFLNRSKALLSKEFFAARTHFGAAAADPIFIVGLPRAGSTLTEQILASHSLVEGTMELPDIMAMAAELGGAAERWQDSAYPEVLARLSAAECRALGERYIERTRIQRKSGKPFFIDKMPNNFQHIGLIRLALPKARIIDVRRHPLACCFSGFKQNFARGQRFSYSLEHIGRYYRDYVELMAHFDAALPGAIHRVIYERLVDDTEAEVRRLLDYCGLPFEAGTLSFHRNERAVRTASAQQVRRPINRDGLEQWRHFEPWLQPLKDSLGAVLEAYPDAPQF